MTEAAVELFLALVGAATILSCAAYIIISVLWEAFGKP